MSSKQTYLARVSQRASLQEQRANALASEATHMRLSLDAALGRIRELEAEVIDLRARIAEEPTVLEAVA